ncbi:hypothetical protein [Bifidobacterium callitrichos]|uniref:hypothetical protein n=1 Tax=Bifidobacterium callitrichos TaxID=762209 RepID=UPI0011B27383|nr:hypothetical protein [Bifidobacterium callitrichos]
MITRIGKQYAPIEAHRRQPLPLPIPDLPQSIREHGLRQSLLIIQIEPIRSPLIELVDELTNADVGLHH